MLLPQRLSREFGRGKKQKKGVGSAVYPRAGGVTVLVGQIIYEAVLSQLAPFGPRTATRKKRPY